MRHRAVFSRENGISFDQVIRNLKMAPLVVIPRSMCFVVIGYLKVSKISIKMYIFMFKDDIVCLFLSRGYCNLVLCVPVFFVKNLVDPRSDYTVPS